MELDKKEKEPTVFLVQENPYVNVLSAEEYRKLRNFDDNDHLLMMGDPAAMGIACCIASDMNRGKFKILKWDKVQKRYYSVSVNINEKGEIDEQDKL